MSTLIVSDLDLAKVHVFNDYVLIKPLANVPKTESGIIVPNHINFPQQTNRGYVVKIGSGYPIPVESESYDIKPKTIPLQSRNGDLALFFTASAVEITYKKQVYYIVREVDILFVEREED